MRYKFGVSGLVLLFLVAGLGYSQTQEKKAPNGERPNIIVMYSDDHTAQSIGAYRDALDYGLKLDHTPTPHIDRLAEGGMRFDNAFVTNSICKPSRAVLLTGLHSHLNGVFTNGESISTELETFPKMLQSAGYQTAMIGKWHLGTEPQGFDYYEVLYGQGPYYNPTMRTSNGDREREGYTSEIITDRALHWLKQQRQSGEPFMLTYNHKAPHRNWIPGPRHINDYRGRDLPEPDDLFYDYSGLASPAGEQDMEIGTTMQWGWDLKVPLNPETGDSSNWERVVKVNRFTDEQRRLIEEAYGEANRKLYDQYDQMSEKERVQWKYQRYVKDYLRVVRGVDDGVGRLMAYLERENLMDNTVVIYAGDQGFFLGENGWFDKRWIYEESMRMPLIVHWPEGIAPGSVDDHLVQNLDLAPTALDLAGAEIPARMQGRSLLPLLKGEKADNWREAVYYHYYEGPPAPHDVARHYGLRTGRYTLAHYYDYDEWELFDLEKDPEQLQSVYGESEYSGIQQKLKKKLQKLQDKYEVEIPQDLSAGEEWVPLFNGKNFDGWHTLPGGEWTIKDGTIIGTSSKDEERHGLLMSDEVYGDFTVRLEYKINQGDSGFYFRTEEVDESVGVNGFQVEIDTNNESGGLYETGGRAWVVKPSPYRVKQWHKPDEWNTLKVTADGKHTVVHINGHKTAELRDDPGRTEGRFGLQLHGNMDMDVRFRDIEMLKE